MKKFLIFNLLLVLFMSISINSYANSGVLAQTAAYKLFINGIEMILKNPIVVINDSTYIPLRELAEILAMDVKWNEQSKTITVNKDNQEDGSLFPFKSNNLWGYKDFNGNIIVEPKYYEANKLCDGMGLVKKGTGQNGQYGFIDTEGNVAIPCIYYDAYSFSDDVALVSLATRTDENRWTFIDKQGNRLFDNEFELARSFHEGYAAVVKKGYLFPVPPTVENSVVWSYIDKKGNYVTELEFEEATDFCDGYAKVKNNGKWGLINSNFEIVVDYMYDSVDEF